MSWALIRSAGGGPWAAAPHAPPALARSAARSAGATRQLLGEQNRFLYRGIPVGRIGRIARIHGPVVEAVVVEEHLEERGALQRALDQQLRERIFDVALQGTAQRPGAIVAVQAGLIHDPFLGFGRARHADVALR